jgi:hypothetical protein
MRTNTGTADQAPPFPDLMGATSGGHVFNPFSCLDFLLAIRSTEQIKGNTKSRKTERGGLKQNETKAKNSCPLI